MTLKTYQIQQVNLDKMCSEVSQYIQNFQGLVFDSGTLEISGDSIIDEQSLDLAIANHDPIFVPYSITPRQARQALFLNGITSQMIESAINQLPSPNKELALIEWEFSTAFIRTNPLVNQIGAVFGKTAAEIDQIWILGDSL